ncbi:dihydrofolate reductase, partial [Candidatus Kaiserbacteria bacterium]|nr:dihydrofolate reductase [Candidatus Kaiserbacteria bacterium]
MKQKNKYPRQPREYKARFVAYLAASIDGKISLTTRHPPEWTSKEDWAFFQKELGKCDAVVVGRNTFEGVRKRLSKRNTFVFSRASKAREGRVTFINPARTDLKKLFAPYTRIALVGGAGVYQFMLNKGLMDELYVTIEPLV